MQRRDAVVRNMQSIQISTAEKSGSNISIGDFFRRYPVLLLFTSITLIANIAYMTMIPLVPLYFRSHFHVTHEIYIGIAISAYVTSETILKPLTGSLGDRFRRTGLVIMALLIATITPHLLAHSRSTMSFIIIRMVDGVGAALLWPSIIALFADATDEEHRATAMSLFTTCMLIGMGAGMTLSTFLKAWLGTYQYVFIMISAVACCALIATLLLNKKISISIKQRQKHLETSDEKPGFMESIRKITSNRSAVKLISVLIFLAFAQMFGTSMLTPITVLFTSDELGWQEKELWKMFLGAGVVLALLAIPAGRMADRIGKENAVKLGMGISSVCLLLMVGIRQPWTLVLAGIGYGVSFAIGAPAWMALVTHGEWADLRGTVLGVVTSFQGAGAIAGPIFGTTIYHHFGHYSPFAVTGLILLFCLVISLFWLRPIKPAEEK